MSEEIKQAFSVFEQAFKNDPDYVWSWHCNIAMPMYDALQFNNEASKISYFEANIAAARVMNHLFKVDMTQNTYYVEWLKSYTQTNVPDIKIVDDSPEAYEQVKEAFNSDVSGVSIGVIVSPELSIDQSPHFIHIDESLFVDFKSTNKDEPN